MVKKIEIFKGKKQQWYFRLVAGNGKIVAQSEGYQSRFSVRMAVWKLGYSMRNNSIKVEQV